jgi:phosphate transport system substrate-binding protein
VIDVWAGVALAALGVAVPVGAALYEFVFKGRKRLGYRVQMDTTATDVAGTIDAAGALTQLQMDGHDLQDPTLVLLRIENNGFTNIDPHDYAVLDTDKVGLRVRFPGRRVAGVVVTELSHEFLRPAFEAGSGMAVKGDVIELPKVPLNRSAHYKVLAALERGENHDGRLGVYDDPQVVGGIKGGVGGGQIQVTRARTGAPKRTIALVVFLMMLVVGQLFVFLRNNAGTPLDCATGRLTLVGSTAAGPVLREAAGTYAKTCDGATFALDLGSSGVGLEKLNTARSAEMIAFSDGPKPDLYPGLVPRPLALFLFTLVVNEDAGVHNLSIARIREIYQGRYTNWSEIGGNDVPILLVSRNTQSGTRTTFQKRILAGVREEATNSNDCRDRDPGGKAGPLRCERGSTGDLLDVVAKQPGAMGYSELGAATGRTGVALVTIGESRATSGAADQGAYPFWETEFGYTYGEPPATSLAASFLRYLTNQVGADILRTHGNRPCDELRDPALCRPARPAGSP